MRGRQAAPDGKVHVVCTGDYGTSFGKVSVINTTSDVVSQTITVGGSPGNIAISAAGVGYLGTFGAGLITYTSATGAIRDSATHPVLAGTDGSGVTFDVAGNVYVAAFGLDKVIKINAANAMVKEYTVGDGPLSVTTK